MFLSTSPGIWLFALQYIPHAFVSKLSWMINVPVVNRMIKKIMSIVNYAFCCYSKQTVKPIYEDEKGDVKTSKEREITLWKYSK